MADSCASAAAMLHIHAIRFGSKIIKHTSIDFMYDIFFTRALSLVHVLDRSDLKQVGKTAFQTTATINNIATVKRRAQTTTLPSLCDVLIFTHTFFQN